jgi:hypothetical protein
MPKDAHTRTSLARESGSAWVPMSQSRLCGAPRAGLGRVRLGSPGPSVGLGSPPARYWFVRVWVVESQARNHVGFHV